MLGRKKAKYERDWLEEIFLKSIEKVAPELENTEENEEIIKGVVEKSIPNIVEILEDHISNKSFGLLRKHRREHRNFKQDLYKIWKKPIDSLEIFISLNLEYGEKVANSYRKKNVQDKKFEVLVRIHARACQIASEILELIKSGFADGALARWRSLYEISVIANFLKSKPPELCQRYLDYKLIEDYFEAIEYQKHCEKLGQIKFSDEEFSEIEESVYHLQDKYGKDFIKPYGWIGEFLPKGNWNFAGIEETIDFNFLRPYYKLANNYVHSGAKGFLFKMGTFHQDKIMLAGPSNYGFADAGQNTANSLLMTTMTLSEFEFFLEDAVFISLCTRLLDKLDNEFVETQLELEKEK